MAKLIWVGENQGNVGGSSSKAYLIRRAGSSVKIRYGAVEVSGGRGGKYSWFSSYPKIITKRFGSVGKAAAFIKKTVASKITKGYDKMPGRVRFQ